VNSSTGNVEKYSVEDDKSEPFSNKISVYLKNLNETKDYVRVDFFYLIENVIIRNNTSFTVSNKGYDEDLLARIELTITNLYKALNPAKVITGDTEEQRTSALHNETRMSFYTYIVPALRRTYMKDGSRGRINRGNDTFKTVFDVHVKKNASSVIDIIMNEKEIKIKSGGNLTLYFNSHNSNVLRDIATIQVFGANEFIETIISLFVIALIVSICYYFTKK